MIEAPTLELPGGRAKLEPLCPAHAQDLFEAVDDEGCWRYTPWPRAASVADMRAYIDSALALRDKGTDVPFAIIDRTTGRAAGTTRYCDVLPAHRHVEIGWTMVGPAAQRTSINTECKFLLLRHAFEAIAFAGDKARGCVRVTLKCDARNLRSQAAIVRIGATFEGCLRKHRVMPDGYLRDTMCYSIIAEEWARVSAGLQSMLARAR